MTDHKPLSEGEMRNDIVYLLHIEADASEELHPGDSDIEVMRSAAKEIERLRSRDKVLTREILAADTSIVIGDKEWVVPSPVKAEIERLRASPKPLDGEAVDEKTLRHVLAEEIKERGGPQEYIAMLGNRWMEIDSELPPELSAALAAMKRAALRARSTQKEATEEEVENALTDDATGLPIFSPRTIIASLTQAGLRIVKDAPG